MRLFLFPLLTFWSFSALSQIDPGSGGLGPCVQATFGTPSNGGTFECSTVTLSGPIAFSAGAGPLVIKATGTVTISGAVSFNGEAGQTRAAFSGSFGGDGGPGADNGGGDDGGGGAQPGTGGSSASGSAAPLGAACGHGGGGAGGILITGGDGGDCNGGGNDIALGGTIFPSFDITTLLRGGFGGGAGSDAGTNYGSGGGGGGAIHIIAAGDVIITAIGSLTATGGAGGSGAPDGGGGGGGSGGVIWFQTLSNITIDGVINSDGGSGGTGGTGGPGGAGRHGILRLEDSDGIIGGATVLPGYTDRFAVSGNNVSSRSSLSSEISCGTITKPNEKQNLLFQMMMGFALALSLGLISKKKKS